MSKKLQQIEGWNGLRANYGGGDYTVTIWDDMDGGYDMYLCRSNTNIPHQKINATADELEAKMREFQPDLRKWRKVEYEG